MNFTKWLWLSWQCRDSIGPWLIWIRSVITVKILYPFQTVCLVRIEPESSLPFLTGLIEVQWGRGTPDGLPKKKKKNLNFAVFSNNICFLVSLFFFFSSWNQKTSLHQILWDGKSKLKKLRQVYKTNFSAHYFSSKLLKSRILLNWSHRHY